MNRKLIAPILLLSLCTAVISCDNNTDKSNSQATSATSSNASNAHSAETPNSHPSEAPHQEQPTVKAAALNIPEFTFYKIKSGIAFTKADITAGKNTAFILFDPSCSHCQHETAELAKNYEKIKDINIYYVSMNDPALMSTFLKSFGKELEGKPNIEVLYDRNQDFIQKIHIPNQFPANYVYGADGVLKSYWEGEKPINEVIQAFIK